jgi:hypothetical protein
VVADGLFTPATIESKGSGLVTYTAAPAFITVTSSPPAIAADNVTTATISARVTTNVPDGVGGFVPVDDGTPVTFTTSLGTWASTGAQTITAGTVAFYALVLAPRLKEG